MRYLHEASRSAEEPDNMSFDQYRSFPAVLESARNTPSATQFLPVLSSQQFAGLSRMIDIFLILASFVLAEKIYNWYFYDFHQVAALDVALSGQCSRANTVTPGARRRGKPRASEMGETNRPACA